MSSSEADMSYLDRNFSTLSIGKHPISPEPRSVKEIMHEQVLEPVPDSHHHMLIALLVGLVERQVKLRIGWTQGDYVDLEFFLWVRLSFVPSTIAFTHHPGFLQ